MRSLFPSLDADLLRALSWCALGSSAGYGRPEEDGAFHRAEALGLLRHDSVWAATPQGEGVLIALGLMKPTWQKDRTAISILWAREPHEGALAQFVRGWPDGYREHWSDGFDVEVEEAKSWWRDHVDIGTWLFWVENLEIPRGLRPASV